MSVSDYNKRRNALIRLVRQQRPGYQYSESDFVVERDLSIAEWNLPITQPSVEAIQTEEAVFESEYNLDIQREEIRSRLTRLPVLTTAQREGLTRVPNGALVIDSTLNQLAWYNDGAWHT